MQFIILSHILSSNSPVHADLKKPEIVQSSQISIDGYNSYILTFENHSGTHVDAPGHFLENGKTISEYKPEELLFAHPLILDVPKDVDELIELSDLPRNDYNGVDALFFRTGFERYAGDERYLTQNPGISPKLIYWFRKKYPNIRCIGIDCISISAYQKPEMGREAHLIAFKADEKLGDPLLLIEDMKLNHVKRELQKVMVVPWHIKGIDSAPCTVIGLI